METNDTTAAIKALDEAIEDVRAVSEADGKASYADLAGLLDKWNHRVMFGDKNVFEVALATDVPAEWYQHLTLTYMKERRFPAGSGALMLGALLLLYFRSWLAYPATLGLLCIGVLLCSAYRIGHRAGRIQGFDDGICKGHCAAVFHRQGIAPADEREFWSTYLNAKMDKDLSDFLGSRSSSRRSGATA